MFAGLLAIIDLAHPPWGEGTEVDITLLEHPTQEPGKMVWQTTATVIRDEIMYLCNKQPNDKQLEVLRKDLESCAWYIESDKNGMISLVEAEDWNEFAVFV